METSTEPHYSEIEVQDLLQNLTRSDIARSLQIYRTLGCYARAGLSEDDVLGQVVLKALSLDRRWPRNIETISFLVTTGKSIISNEAEKQAKLIITPTIDQLLTSKDDALIPTSATTKLSHAPAESTIEYSQSENAVTTWTQKVKQLFEDDPEAHCFIKQKLNEQKKSAILILCVFTDQVYRNVEKRIKDKVRKRFPNGLPWWEVE